MCFGGLFELTCLTHNPPNPRAIVVHFLDASINFTAVMRPVWFPGATAETPSWFSVRFADESVFAVKGLQPWAIRVLVWSNIAVRVGLYVVGLFMLVSTPTWLLFLLLLQPPYRSLSEGDDAGILMDDQEESNIGQDH